MHFFLLYFFQKVIVADSVFCYIDESVNNSRVSDGLYQKNNSGWSKIADALFFPPAYHGFEANWVKVELRYDVPRPLR